MKVMLFEISLNAFNPILHSLSYLWLIVLAQQEELISLQAL